jgi:hypothetical protein
MTPPPNRFATTIRKLEDLPTDGGQAVDTLAGANLRIFMRLHQLEAALVRMSRRVAALEAPAGAESPGSSPGQALPARGNGAARGS